MTPSITYHSDCDFADWRAEQARARANRDYYRTRARECRARGLHRDAADYDAIAARYGQQVVY